MQTRGTEEHKNRFAEAVLSSETLGKICTKKSYTVT